jgi:hypothetical protein
MLGAYPVNDLHMWPMHSLVFIFIRTRYRNKKFQNTKNYGNGNIFLVLNQYVIKNSGGVKIQLQAFITHYVHSLFGTLFYIKLYKYRLGFEICRSSVFSVNVHIT